MQFCKMNQKKKLQPNEQKLLTHSLHAKTSLKSRKMLQIWAQSSIEKIIKYSLAKEQTMILFILNRETMKL